MLNTGGFQLSILDTELSLAADGSVGETSAAFFNRTKHEDDRPPAKQEDSIRSDEAEKF